MANQVIVTNTGNVQVALTPPPNVQVQISRAAIGTVSNVLSANFANYAGNVTGANQPNITSLGTLGNLSVSGTITSGNVSTPTVYSQGMQMQGYDYVQMQYSNSVALPVSPYDIGTGSWFYLDAGGAVWQSNTTGALQTVVLGNNGNISATGNITAPYFIGNGSQLTGIVATGGNANFANYAGNVINANQPNITNIGTLANLNVSNTITTKDLVVTGNFSVGNLVANNANYANFAGQANTANLATYATTANSVAGANVSGVVANANYSAYSGQANTANLATYATTANSVAGANVSGQVANANYANYSNIANTANSVAVANVSGIGNIATVNLDGNVANLLTGNGTFVAIPTGGGNTDNISNGTSNVSIPVIDGNVQVYANSQHWAFTDVGNLLLAGGNGVIQSIANSSLDPINPNVSTMVLTPDQGNSSQALVLDPTTPGHIHLRAPGSNIDQPQANVYLGGEASSFEVGVFNGAVPNLFIHSNNNTWMFDIDGNLTLPGNSFAVNYANGTQVPLDGPVANANYANFAGTAYSVDGANVSGEVANANYSSYANIATTANSVALANVSGIGNIANINLDGSSSNVLFGNGVFAPESTSIANANYANFAGTLINGNSNITIVSNANINMSVSGNANVVQIDGNGTIVVAPIAGGYNNLVRYNNYGQTANGQNASRINSTRYRGNATAPLSVAPNDGVMDLIAVAYNGTGLSTNGTARFKAVVDAGYVANASNVPIGWQIQVTDNVNSQKVHNFYSNGNVTFANAIFGNSLSVSGNVDGAFILGNGSSLTSLTGANVTGTVANANYAAYAGNVTIGSQPNITSTGNLISVNINNGNVVLPTMQIEPNGIVVGSTANYNYSPNSLVVVTDYGNGQGDGNLALTKTTSYLRARGNSTTTTAVSAGDHIHRDNFYAYNGTSNVLHASIRTAVSNTNANSNAIWGGGNVVITTGNPLGDTGNANAQSAYNTYTFDQWGRQIITQGTAPTGVTQGMLVFNMYGGSAGANANTSAGISFNRFWGNRDSNLAVGPGTQTGRIFFSAASSNGTGATYTGRVAQFGAQVDSNYVQGTANVPQGMFMQVCDNTTQYSHNFYANSNVVFASTSTVFANSFSATNNVSGASLSASGTVSGGTLSATGTVSGFTLASANSITAANDITANSTITGATLSSTGNISAVGNITANNVFSNGVVSVSGNLLSQGGYTSLSNSTGGATVVNMFGDKTPNSQFSLDDSQFSVTLSNVDCSGGFSPFRFQQYAPNNSRFGQMYYYRARGNDYFTSAPVVAGDQIMQYNFIVNSNNVTTSIGTFTSEVTYNDNAGNVGSKLELTAQGTGTTGYLNGVINLLANTTNANNFAANNVTINNSVNGFMKLSSYTAAALNAITGSIGWMAAVSDSGGGGNPNGMMAFWDTTHTRWSYIHDNSAV